MSFDLKSMITDREAGTQGKFETMAFDDLTLCVTDNNGVIIAHDIFCLEDTRRIARVPDMEEEIIRLTARVQELECEE